MKRFWIAIFIALAIIVTSQPSFAEKRIALVIGNGAYPKFGSLKNPPNDAKLMARTLRSLGFEVIERIDANQKGMKKAIKAFGNKLEAGGKDAVGLFYYAGHGVQVGGENFLIPVNADIQTEADVDIEAVSANDVQGYMAFAGNDLNIIIMDACRNNPFKRSFRSASRGLAKMDASKGTLIAYATSPGDVAADGKGANSPYTEALAKAMLMPGLTVERMFKEVRNQVVTATNSKQVPWEASSLTGADFYFNGGGATLQVPTAAAPSTQTAPAVDKETVFWRSIQTSKDASMFEAYLEQYPNGSFAALARAKVKAFTKNTVVAQTETANLPTNIPARTVVTDEQIRSILDNALSLTTAISDREKRAKTLISLARSQFKAGDVNSANRTISEAESEVDEVTNNKSRKSYILSSLAEAKATMKDFAGSIQVANRINNISTKSYTFSIISKLQAMADDLDGARQSLRATRRIGNSDETKYSRYYNLRHVATGMVWTGDVSGALQLAKGIDAIVYRESALAQIAREIVEAGDVIRGIRMAKEILNPDQRDRTFITIISALLNSGNLADAKSLVRNISSSTERVSALTSIAIKMAKKGKLQGARSYYTLASDEVEAIDIERRNAYMALLPGIKAYTGEVSGAFSLANGIADPKLRNYALTKIAGAQAYMGDLQGALNTANSIVDQYVRVQGLIGIVNSLIENREDNT